MAIVVIMSVSRDRDPQMEYGFLNLAILSHPRRLCLLTLSLKEKKKEKEMSL